MRCCAALLLMLGLFGTVPFQRFVPRPAASCEICGHACCCPTVCAKRRAARAAAQCEAPESLCRIQPASAGLPGWWAERLERPGMLPRHEDPAIDPISSLRCGGEKQLLFLSSPDRGVPLPPPRSRT